MILKNFEQLFFIILTTPTMQIASVFKQPTTKRRVKISDTIFVVSTFSKLFIFKFCAKEWN